MPRGWLYMVVVLDWYSRFVVSWELSNTLEGEFVLDAVRQGFDVAIPGILNSDQGSQYTSLAYIQLVQAAGVRVSMDGKGRAHDNIFTERFWRSLKYEEVYLKEYSTPREARRSIAKYIELYNYRRPHQALGDRTPADTYQSADLSTGTAMSRVREVIHR